MAAKERHDRRVHLIALLRQIARQARRRDHDAGGLHVGELATLGEIADLLETKHIKRVPVVHDGKIVGIVSRADLLKVLVSGGAGTENEEQDRAIRALLLAELREQKWADASEGRVVVSDGIVYLWGIVGSENERRALRIAAENTPGVRGVEDHTEFAPALPAM